MFSIWWKEIFGKVIPAYMQLVKDDERFVKRDPNGNYINVFIRKAELAGKIGGVELESSEQLPVSDEQKADVIMKLMELNNAEIMQALTSPENLPFIKKIVKMDDFKLPGEDDRQKQYAEIQELLNGQPIEMPPDEQQIMMAVQTGQPPQPIEQPSVEIEPMVDDHTIHAQICKNWAVGEAGRLAKQENPEGYKNVLLHMQAHMQILVQQMMQQQTAQMQQTQSNNNSQPPKPKGNSEISDGVTGNVSTPVQ
jgi:hypothetical protein